jgi:hypothetical protein
MTAGAWFVIAFLMTVPAGLAILTCIGSTRTKRKP